MESDGHSEELLRRSWVRYLSVLIVLVLTVSAFAVFSNVASASSPGPSPSAVGPRHDLYVGVTQLTVQTTNPLQYTLVDEYYILGTVYSFLLNYGPNWELEPDLAISWAQTNTNPSTWEFKLTKNAYFADPRLCTKDAAGHIVSCDTSHPVTGEDVKFTYDYVKLYQDQTSYYKPCTEHIASMAVSPTDPYYVTMTFDGPYAAAIASIGCVPILPKYIWQTLAVDHQNALPIGSGSMMVRPDPTSGTPPTKMITPPPLFLDRNPLWHGVETLGRMALADTMQFVSYQSSGALSVDLSLGKVDIALSPSSQDYIGFLNRAGIRRQSVADGFEAEQAVQVLDDEMRAYFASISSRPVERGSTNPVLRHQTVRSAIHIATDRNKMIANALNGLGTPGNTLLPLFHPWHTDIPPYSADDKNGDGIPFDHGMEEFPEGPAALPTARQMLVDDGWRYVCATGALQTGIEFPLCRRDGAGRMVEPLDFRFSTFNTEPWWETAARGVKEDAEKVGIRFTIELVNPSQMYQLWVKLDYEVWLWDWVWTPITDTSIALIVQTCGGIVTMDNDNGFCMRDATGRWVFDDMYNQTLVETNVAARRALSDEMNRIIYDYASYNLPFYLDQLYAMNEVRFTNWGDFRAQRALPPDIGNPMWLTMFTHPVDQRPPQFSLPTFEGAAGRATQFSVSAIDPEGAALAYRWDFDTATEPGGTGVNNDGILANDDQGGNSPTPTFTYASAGTYGVSLRVYEAGGDFFATKKTSATITPPGTGAPSISAIPFSPTDPTTYTGDLVTFAASASDPAGGALTYTWDFGDGSPAPPSSPIVSHAYATSGTKTVRLTVRNTAGQTAQSSTLANVVDNVAPTVLPLESKAVVVGLEDTFVAFASDANSRDTLTYAWDFGDGQTGSGNPVAHTYAGTGTRTLRVDVSDGKGHTTTSTASINVVADRNTAPAINSFVGAPATTYTNVPVAFTATVTDPEGNSMRWQWDFNNDGTVDLDEVSPLVAPGTAQTRSHTYTFASAGQFRSKLTITDIPPGTAAPKTTFQQFTVRVAANAAPTLTDIGLAPASGIPGQDFAFSSTSNDADGDRLSFTWEWGDGSAPTTGQTGFFGGLISGSHAYGEEGEYLVVLIVNDGKGGEARKSTLVTVSRAALLRVTTGIDIHPTFGVPGKVIVDGVSRDEWATTWVKIAPGEHTVAFSDVWNLGTPDPVTVNIPAGGVAEVQARYRAYGWLRVVTDPPVPGTISVNGAPSDDWEVWRAVPPGSYTISFGSVRDFRPPVAETVTVNAEQLTTVVGRYTWDGASPGPDPATYALLRVTTGLSTDPNAGAPSAISVNGVVRDEWALTWVKIPPGTYTVSFGDVVNLGTPADVTFTLAAGQTREVAGIFQVHGWLRVDTSPPVPGTIFVNGLPYDDWQVWQSMPPGTYKVSFGPVPGFVTPAAIMVDVAGGSLAFVTGAYVSAPTTVGTREPDA